MISSTVVITWVVMAILILIAVLLRIFVIPKMTDKPHGIQTVLELGVEYACKFTKSNVGGLGQGTADDITTIDWVMH